MVKSENKIRTNIDFINKHKLIIMILLVILIIVLTYLFKIHIEIERVFTHFYYIPIILACFWWKKKGLVLSGLLASFLIIFSFIRGDYEIVIYDLFRALMFLIIGLFVVIISTALNKSQSRMKESHIKLKESYSQLNESKKELEKQSNELKKAKKELEQRVNELEKFHNLVVGRELKMVELKEIIKSYKEKNLIKKS